MTEVFSNVSPLSFNVEAQQQQQQGSGSQTPQRQYGSAPPRCAVHGNETFVARGTSAADLESLFGKQPS